MITENLSTLKIHKLTKEQYERELSAGNVDQNALYLTPYEEVVSNVSEVEISDTPPTDENVEIWVNMNEEPNGVAVYATRTGNDSGGNTEIISVQSDWNQNDETAPDYIKNKPFGTEIIPATTIEWDGNTEGKELVEMGRGAYLCKVSDSIFSVDALYGASITGVDLDNNFTSKLEKEHIVDGSTMGLPIFTATCPVSGMDIYVVQENTSIFGGDITFTTGIYFTVYLTSENVSEAYISSLRVAESENVIRIEEKYLPIMDLVGKTTFGTEYTINDETVTAEPAAEVFNNYESNIALGMFSHAEGNSTTASGACSHAEGSHTTASGWYSHAEGQHTKASGEHSHAEGNSTTASGACSHAEGIDTVASGSASHAEGSGTVAQSAWQHVQGTFNIVDENNVYVSIVGNGNTSKRSNAHTLDWDGNAWYAGTVEGTAMIIKSSTEGSTKRFKITVNDSGTISAVEI